MRIPGWIVLFSVMTPWVMTSVARAEPSQARPPMGLSDRQMEVYTHLSEGADLYPYEWMMVLRSATYKDSRGEPLPFFQDLDKRFGMIPGPQSSRYAMSWMGLTTAWSDAHPTKSDASAADASVMFKDENGVKSVKLVGTNCSLCHTSQIEYRGTKTVVPGAPAIMNIRGFFRDLSRSTVSTLMHPKELTRFLEALHVANPKKEAVELSKFFIRRLGEETGAQWFIGLVHWLDVPGWSAFSAQITVAMAKLFKDRHRLYRGKKAIAESLERLCRLTYQFKPEDDLGVLPKRFAYLSDMMVGNNPSIDETAPGFGRTDAFGRIANGLLRGPTPVNQTAPVSFPWLWGMKYMAEMHYNANSNSVLIRNVGQSLGLGAIITDDKCNSTSNLHNIHILEKLTYNIKVPQWEEIFGESAKVDQALAAQGKPLYEAQCARCHTAERHVGPTKELLEYTMRPIDEVGTDPVYAKNIVTPLTDKPLAQGILAVNSKVRDAYFAKWQVPQQVQEEWSDHARRGGDFFRDTLLGASVQSNLGIDYGDVKPGLYYRARHLSGIWATAPYLHNGSVPSIAALLKLEPRPKKFLVRSHEYDPQTLGYVTTRPSDDPSANDEEVTFDTTQLGNSNAGHEHGTTLSEAEKRAIIEYLKILPPEKELAWE